MTRALCDLTLLSLALFGMTTFAAMQSLTLLATTNAIMMVSLPLLGAATFHIFGFASNVGNIFYAVLIYGLSLRYLRCGSKDFLSAVSSILFALSMVFGSIFILQDAQILSSAFAIHIRIVGASFISFWLMQLLFVHLLDRFSKVRPLTSIPIITIAMQAVDSMIFFPCAFAGDVLVEDLLRYTLTGWVTKSILAVISIPFLATYLSAMRRASDPVT